MQYYNCSHLQDYLRKQGDNFLSINLIAEIVSYLSTLYSQIKGSNIELVTQLFTTLNEIVAVFFVIIQIHFISKCIYLLYDIKRIK